MQRFPLRWVAGFSFLFLTFPAGPEGTEAASGCPVAKARSGWQIYINQAYRFCLEYPASQYRPISPPEPAAGWLGYVTLGELECRTQRRGSEHDTSKATIEFWWSRSAFHLQALTREAPTGVIEPPAPVRIGQNTFYYYGPGGGGVSYPDRYYFDLHGKTLLLICDGPYNGQSKSPDPESQTTMREMLATFRTF